MTALGPLVAGWSGGVRPASADQRWSGAAWSACSGAKRSRHSPIADGANAENRLLQTFTVGSASLLYFVPAREISMTATIHARAVSDEEVKAELKREFPGWSIIRSADGRWWAQLFPVPRELFNEPNLVDADTGAELRAELAGLVKP